MGEIPFPQEAAASNESEKKPGFREQLNRYMAGDSHIHSVFSNPESRHEADYTFEKIIRYVKDEIDKGTHRAQFVVLAEHPSDAGDPHLVDGKELLEHRDQINAYNRERAEQGIETPKLISGVEASIIGENGEVDVPDEVLSQMDYVIASKHDLRKVFPDEGGNPNARELEKMYFGLMANDHIDCIGHPTRYVTEETLKEIDWDQLFAKAKETGTGLELNLNALMPEWLIIKAVEAGVPLFIGTDAHSLAQYQNLPEEIKSQVENADDRLNFSPGLKFWWRIARVLKILNQAGVSPDQVITSSGERLNNWLATPKSERKTGVEK